MIPLRPGQIRMSQCSPAHEEEIRRCPQVGGNASAGAGGDYDVVVVGYIQVFEKPAAVAGLNHAQIAEELVNIVAAVVSLAGKAELGVALREIPGERRGERDGGLVILLGN